VAFKISDLRASTYIEKQKQKNNGRSSPKKSATLLAQDLAVKGLHIPRLSLSLLGAITSVRIEPLRWVRACKHPLLLCIPRKQNPLTVFPDHSASPA